MIHKIIQFLILAMLDYFPNRFTFYLTGLYTKWLGKLISKDVNYFLKHGNVEQIRYCGEEVERLGKAAKYEPTIEVGRIIKNNPENIILRRIGLK